MPSIAGRLFGFLSEDRLVFVDGLLAVADVLR